MNMIYDIYIYTFTHYKWAVIQASLKMGDSLNLNFQSEIDN